MQDLKPETIVRFKELYRDYPELIEYRIKFGNIYEKAQALLIKSVAVNVLQMSEAGKQSGILQHTSRCPPSREMESDYP